MTDYEIYVFALCFIVFSLLTATFSYLIYLYGHQEVELIRAGQRDKQIEIDYKKRKTVKYQALLWFGRFASLALCVAFSATFAFALHLRSKEDAPIGDVPEIKVVKSSSMETKNEKNEYLFANELNDQFDMFDIIFCEKLPAEEDLQLYDIIMYKQRDKYIIHRIIAIEEPNEQHPHSRYFTLRGDAVGQSDQSPVFYSQMQGIYRGERVPFVGSFIMFLQSPAGALCMLLIVVAIIIAPIAEGILEKERRARLGRDPEADQVLSSRNRKEAKKDLAGSMTIYYNRPGSPFSEPFQRQDQAIPYRHSQDIDYFSRYEEKRKHRK